MSTKVYALFFLLLVTTSVGVYYISYILGETEGYKSGFVEGKNKGYEIGHEDGYEEGNLTGFISGNNSGYAVGYQYGNIDGYDVGSIIGYEEGNQEGFKTGFQSGFQDGNNSGYTDGYLTGQIKGNESGYIAGYDIGFDLGNTSGYENGYLKGVEDGAGSGYIIRDPTYNEVQIFLWQDKTDENEYIEDVYVCRHFTSDLLRHAFKEGYKGYFVYIGFNTVSHAIVGFNTTDKGMIYIEPQTDDRVYPIIGEVYWDRSNYYPPSYDDTITEIQVIG